MGGQQSSEPSAAPEVDSYNYAEEVPINRADSSPTLFSPLDIAAATTFIAKFAAFHLRTVKRFFDLDRDTPSLPNHVIPILGFHNLKLSEHELNSLLHHASILVGTAGKILAFNFVPPRISNLEYLDELYDANGCLMNLSMRELPALKASGQVFRRRRTIRGKLSLTIRHKASSVQSVLSAFDKIIPAAGTEESQGAVPSDILSWFTSPKKLLAAVAPYFRDFLDTVRPYMDALHEQRISTGIPGIEAGFQAVGCTVNLECGVDETFNVLDMHVVHSQLPTAVHRRGLDARVIFNHTTSEQREICEEFGLSTRSLLSTFVSVALDSILPSSEFILWHTPPKQQSRDDSEIRQTVRHSIKLPVSILETITKLYPRISNHEEDHRVGLLLNIVLEILRTIDGREADERGSLLRALAGLLRVYVLHKPMMSPLARQTRGLKKFTSVTDLPPPLVDTLSTTVTHILNVVGRACYHNCRTCAASPILGVIDGLLPGAPRVLRSRYCEVCRALQEPVWQVVDECFQAHSSYLDRYTHFTSLDWPRSRWSMYETGIISVRNYIPNSVHSGANIENTHQLNTPPTLGRSHGTSYTHLFNLPWCHDAQSVLNVIEQIVELIPQPMLTHIISYCVQDCLHDVGTWISPTSRVTIRFQLDNTQQNDSLPKLKPGETYPAFLKEFLDIVPSFLHWVPRGLRASISLRLGLILPSPSDAVPNDGIAACTMTSHLTHDVILGLEFQLVLSKLLRALWSPPVVYTEMLTLDPKSYTVSPPETLPPIVQEENATLRSWLSDLPYDVSPSAPFIHHFVKFLPECATASPYSAAYYSHAANQYIPYSLLSNDERSQHDQTFRAFLAHHCTAETSLSLKTLQIVPSFLEQLDIQDADMARLNAALAKVISQRWTYYTRHYLRTTNADARSLIVFLIPPEHASSVTLVPPTPPEPLDRENRTSKKAAPYWCKKKFRDPVPEAPGTLQATIPFHELLGITLDPLKTMLLSSSSPALSLVARMLFFALTGPCEPLHPSPASYITVKEHHLSQESKNGPSDSHDSHDSHASAQPPGTSLEFDCFLRFEPGEIMNQPSLHRLSITIFGPKVAINLSLLSVNCTIRLSYKPVVVDGKTTHLSYAFEIVDVTQLSLLLGPYGEIAVPFSVPKSVLDNLFVGPQKVTSPLEVEVPAADIHIHVRALRSKSIPDSTSISADSLVQEVQSAGSASGYVAHLDPNRWEKTILPVMADALRGGLQGLHGAEGGESKSEDVSARITSHALTLIGEADRALCNYLHNIPLEKLYEAPRPSVLGDEISLNQDRRYGFSVGSVQQNWSFPNWVDETQIGRSAPYVTYMSNDEDTVHIADVEEEEPENLTDHLCEERSHIRARFWSELLNDVIRCFCSSPETLFETLKTLTRRDSSPDGESVVEIPKVRGLHSCFQFKPSVDQRHPTVTAWFNSVLQKLMTGRGPGDLSSLPFTVLQKLASQSSEHKSNIHEELVMMISPNDTLSAHFFDLSRITFALKALDSTTRQFVADADLHSSAVESLRSQFPEAKECEDAAAQYILDQWDKIPRNAFAFVIQLPNSRVYFDKSLEATQRLPKVIVRLLGFESWMVKQLLGEPDMHEFSSQQKRHQEKFRAELQKRNTPSFYGPQQSNHRYIDVDEYVDDYSNEEEIPDHDRIKDTATDNETHPDDTDNPNVEDNRRLLYGLREIANRWLETNPQIATVHKIGEFTLQ